MLEESEYVLLNKKEVFVYKIPPRQPQGHRAEDWKECIWCGNLQLINKAMKCEIRLLDSNTNKLFACCPVPDNYDEAVERTVDSSRYFVLRVADGQGRHAFIGMGFESRNDAFDFNCTLSDNARRRQVEVQRSTELLSDKPQKDYRLKEGEKIRVQLKGVKTRPRRNSPTSRESGLSSGATGLVPPPPASKNRSLPREKSPFDDFPLMLSPASSPTSPAALASSDLDVLTPSLVSRLLPPSPKMGTVEDDRKSEQITKLSGIEQELLEIEFSDFQACPPELGHPLCTNSGSSGQAIVKPRHAGASSYCSTHDIETVTEKAPILTALDLSQQEVCSTMTPPQLPSPRYYAVDSPVTDLSSAAVSSTVASLRNDPSNSPSPCHAASSSVTCSNSADRADEDAPTKALSVLSLEPTPRLLPTE